MNCQYHWSDFATVSVSIATLEITQIESYNSHFATTDQKFVTLDQTITDDLNQLINESLLEHRPVSSMQNATVRSMQNIPVQPIVNGSDMFDSPSELFLTILPATENDPGYQQTDAQPRCAENDMMNDNGDSVISCLNCCKGHQRVLNKIDYVHKKFSKDLSLLREETSSIRKLLMQLLDQQRQGQQNETVINEGDGQAEPVSIEPVKVDVVEVDNFNEKFKSTFPIEDADSLVDFNKSMRDDQNFMDKLFSKLAQLKAEDEIKTARKILKALCSGTCLKEFTWQGTKRMKSFENLHLIVELLTKLVKEKYPGCDALEIVTKVVKQRTKSAKEGKERNADSLIAGRTPSEESSPAENSIQKTDETISESVEVTATDSEENSILSGQESSNVKVE